MAPARLFRPRWWDHQRELAVERAFQQVPFYREQWAVAGRALLDSGPVRARDLAREAYRLCPLARPWQPSRQPSLWTGSPRPLGEALALAKALSRRDPVLEIRPATVDWTKLAPFGTPYGVLLAPDARVAAGRRQALQVRGLELAVAHGRAVVVGSPTELAGTIADAGGAAVDWSPVHRLTPGQAAATAHPGGTPVVVHDPVLGYVAARQPDCGEIHLLWTRVHCRATDEGLVFTRIRGRRPTLVNVIPIDPGFSAVGRCHRHGTPVLGA